MEIKAQIVEGIKYNANTLGHQIEDQNGASVYVSDKQDSEITRHNPSAARIMSTDSERRYAQSRTAALVGHY